MYCCNVVATSCELGYLCPLLYQVSSCIPVLCGGLVHSYNTGQEIFYYPTMHSGPVGSPASAAAAGMVLESCSSPMTTARKASC